MEAGTTLGKYIEYQINMQCKQSSFFDNEEVMGRRLTFVLVIKGCGVMEWKGKEVTYMGPSLFCVNEKEHIQIPDAEEQKILILYVHPNVINSSLQIATLYKNTDQMPITRMQDIYLFRYFTIRECVTDGCIGIGPLTCKRIEKLMYAIKHHIEEQEGAFWPCRSRSFLLELLFLLEKLEMKPGIGEVFCEEEDSSISPILQYLYHNYSEKITVEDLTKKFHLNRTTLAKLFQDSVGESVITYLNKLRITVSSGMLRDTMLPISEIMERVGFHDSAHFFRTFKKVVGVSPSEYRQRYCWMVGED